MRENEGPGDHLLPSSAHRYFETLGERKTCCMGVLQMHLEFFPRKYLTFLPVRLSLQILIKYQDLNELLIEELSSPPSTCFVGHRDPRSLAIEFGVEIFLLCAVSV